jgi:hypothetical protein
MSAFLALISDGALLELSNQLLQKFPQLLQHA